MAKTLRRIVTPLARAAPSSDGTESEDLLTRFVASNARAGVPRSWYAALGRPGQAKECLLQMVWLRSERRCSGEQASAPRARLLRRGWGARGHQ